MLVDELMEAEWHIFASVNEGINGSGSSAPMICLCLYHWRRVSKWTRGDNVKEIYIEFGIRCVSNIRGDGLKAQINIFSFKMKGICSTLCLSPFNFLTTRRCNRGWHIFSCAENRRHTHAVLRRNDHNWKVWYQCRACTKCYTVYSSQHKKRLFTRYERTQVTAS